MIHRDLAARNILVTDNDQMKIGDFGLCRSIDSNDTYYQSRGGNLPLKWMPPESIKHFEFSIKSDVYVFEQIDIYISKMYSRWSYGIVLFELITIGGSPYPGIQPHDLLSYLIDGNRMTQPNNCPDELYVYFI